MSNGAGIDFIKTHTSLSDLKRLRLKKNHTTNIVRQATSANNKIVQLVHRDSYAVIKK